MALKAAGLIFRANPRGFVLAAALQVVGAVAALGVVWSGKLALETMLSPAPSATKLIPALTVLAIASAVNSGITMAQIQQQRLLGEDVGAASWQRLLAVTGRVNLQEVETPEFIDQVERLESNALERPSALATATLSLLGSLVSLVALTAAVLSIEPLLVPVLGLAGIPTLALSRRASRSEFTFATRWSELARTRMYVREILYEREFAAEIRANQTDAELLARHRELSRRFRAVLRSQVRRRQILTAAIALVNSLALALALGLIAVFVTNGRMSLAVAGSGVLAVRLLSSQLDRLFSAIGSVVEAGPFLAELEEFIARAKVTPSSDDPPWPIAEGVSMRGITYRYPGSERDVLHGVDIDIAPGELVAIVGENGSGKTTLSKILAGLYVPSGGSVSWDGRPVTEPELPSLRRSVSVIMQDFVRYHLVAADNIDLSGHRWGRGRAEIERAADEARIGDQVRRLPQGFDTMLGRAFSGGVDLSGGQWQRIALARALVRRSPVVVFDEPTSALDPRAERDFVHNVRHQLAERAVMFVSHRYANLHLADRIYVLAEGRVVEAGRHDQLMAAGGLYSELYKLQSQAYQRS